MKNPFSKSLMVKLTALFFSAAVARDFRRVLIQAKVMESVVAQALGGETVQTVSDLARQVEHIVNNVVNAGTGQDGSDALYISVDSLDRNHDDSARNVVEDPMVYEITN